MAKKKELKKHTSAIHTNGKLSLLERKLSNVLLYNAYDDLLTNRFHEIPLYALAEISGFNSKDMVTFKESLRNLKRVEIEWDVLNEDGTKAWGSSNLLASVEITKGICTYEYSGKLAEKLSSPDLYGIINLEIQKNFSSSYSLTIYEVCSRYKGLLKKRDHCYTQWYTIEEFKTILGISDVEYYGSFKRLNDKILKPSINEINGSLKKFAGTDIHIHPEYKRKGRAISDVRFKITSNIQAPLPLVHDEHEDIRKTEHYAQLLELGMQDKGAIHVIQTTDSNRLAENIAATKQAEASGKIKSSVSGFLAKAIQDDYKPVTKKTAGQKKKEQKQSDDVELLAKKEKFTKSYSKELRTAYIATLSEEEQSSLLEELRRNKPDIIKKVIKTLSSPAIAGEINERVPNFSQQLQAYLDDELGLTARF